MTLSRLEHEMCIIGGEMKFQNEKEIRRIDWTIYMLKCPLLKGSQYKQNDMCLFTWP